MNKLNGFPRTEEADRQRGKQSNGYVDAMDIQSSPKFSLSFCIATFNRAAFIGATLEMLVTQAGDACEIIVSDNASTDNTEQVVSDYKRRFKHLHYFRQDENVGPDRNFDRAVALARGEFCWLMGDDDILKPGAVTHVLESLHPDLSLILVNMEIRDISMSKVIRSRWINIRSDRLYEPEDMDRFFTELGNTLGSVSNIVVKRSVWLSRDRERYFGSMFIHVGVIYQKKLPGKTLVIATPLINYRAGNNERWFNVSPEIFLEKWPSVIESLALSDSTKEQIGRPWRQFQLLVFLRTRGYSLANYRCWIHPRVSSGYETLTPILVALLPVPLARILYVFFRFDRPSQEGWTRRFKQSLRSR